MAHAQKPDLVFQRNGRVHLYRRGCQFSRLLAVEVCASAVVMLDRPCPIKCTTAGYPLHSPFSPSLLHPCVSVCRHIPFLLYITEQERLMTLIKFSCRWTSSLHRAFRKITSTINQQMHLYNFNLKHLKPLRHISIFSDHHQGVSSFLAKVITYSRFCLFL